MPVVRSICPGCKAENPDHAIYCKDCGTRL